MNTLDLTDDELRELYWLAADGLMSQEQTHATTEHTWAAWNKLLAMRNALPTERRAA